MLACVDEYGDHALRQYSGDPEDYASIEVFFGVIDGKLVVVR